ncbi:invasin domain 3-containing protein [Geitlerinema splendidum]|nr:invasin domain 3-containing protein [Geitlerinema splendidum]
MSLLLLTSVAVMANTGTIALEAYPAVTVADGRSTLTITAQVRDQSGSVVPNGTQVVFDTSIGSFRDRIVTTQNGYARAVLVSGDVPGIARIRASVLRFNAAGDLEVEFVANRSMLSAAREFVEVVGSDSLIYSVDDRIIEATGDNRGAMLKYRDIEITADDLQLRVQAYEVNARRAIIKIAGKTYEFEDIHFKLNRRTGFGTANARIPVADPSKTGVFGLPISYREEFRLYEISAEGLKVPEKRPDLRVMAFQDISASVSMISAKKAVAYPRKEVQFHKADVKVAHQTVMQVPLFKVSVNTSSPVITEQFFNVSNNNVAVNYPYYLSLKPGETSLLRARWGSNYSTGAGASRGAFLDYELNWNKGDMFDGGMTVFGIGRDDWGLGLRQTWASSDSTTLSTTVDFPAHKSMFAGANLSRQFPGFSLNANASHGRSFGNGRFTSDSLNVVLEKDPTRLGSLPGRMYFGLSASQNKFKAGEFASSQDVYGGHMRLVSDPLRLAPNHTLNISYTLSHLTGSNARNGFSQTGTITIGSNPLPGLAVNTLYEYVDDGFTSTILGKHKLTLEAYYQSGRTSISGFWTKSLDIERMNASARMRYDLGNSWRFSYLTYFDEFGIDSYFDQSFILSYRLGYREIGLSYSHRTKRIGLELLGTSFN